MSTPTAEQLRDPDFAKSLLDAICAQPFEPGRTFIDLLRRRPKFRRMREVHGARARKLRRRGEYVHFLRWSAVIASTAGVVRCQRRSPSGCRTPPPEGQSRPESTIARYCWCVARINIRRIEMNR